MPDQRPDRTLELLRAHLDRRGFGEVTITELAKADPAVTPLDDPFVRRCIAVAEAVFGVAPRVMPIFAGSLPFIAPLQRYAGVPGLSVCDNATYFGSAAHAPNENIRLEDIQPAVRYLHALLTELGS